MIYYDMILSRKYLLFIGLCIISLDNVNYHWAKMTSGVFMLVDFGHLSKTMFILFIVIMVTYLIVCNIYVIKLCSYNNEINQLEHHMNHNSNILQLTLTFM